MDLKVGTTPHGASFEIKVQANARRTAMHGLWNGALKMKVAPKAENGAANQAILEFFTQQLKVAKSQLTIVRGEFSSHKVIRVEGLSAEMVKKRLASDLGL
jgi:uncharacterized protein